MVCTQTKKPLSTAITLTLIFKSWSSAVGLYSPDKRTPTNAGSIPATGASEEP